MRYSNVRVFEKVNFHRYTGYLSFPFHDNASVSPEIACQNFVKMSHDHVFILLQVAAYDFLLDVTINQTSAPQPSASPYPVTPKQGGSLHTINPRPVHVTVATPKRKVMATALRQPLQMSHLDLDFDISAQLADGASGTEIMQTKVG